MLLLFIVSLAGCVSFSSIQAPPEYNQKVILEVSDNYEMYQAPRSTYDVGDLQSFHTQHTFPFVIEDAFKEVFGEVEVRKPGMKIEAGEPEVPAIFEVNMIDAAHDFESGADSYRGEVTVAVAMKSPRGKIFWQKAFRGEGYVILNNEFSIGLGPNDALVDAVRDAIDQIQRALVNSPQVRNQMRYYHAIDQARKEREVQV